MSPAVPLGWAGARSGRAMSISVTTAVPTGRMGGSGDTGPSDWRCRFSGEPLPLQPCLSAEGFHLVVGRAAEEAILPQLKVREPPAGLAFREQSGESAEDCGVDPVVIEFGVPSDWLSIEDEREPRHAPLDVHVVLDCGDGQVARGQVA